MKSQHRSTFCSFYSFDWETRGWGVSRNFWPFSQEDIGQLTLMLVDLFPNFLLQLWKCWGRRRLVLVLPMPRPTSWAGATWRIQSGLPSGHWAFSSELDRQNARGAAVCSRVDPRRPAVLQGGGVVERLLARSPVERSAGSWRQAGL